MAKVITRIPLHRNKPDKFIQLMKDVVARHEADGVASPLNSAPWIDMPAFKLKLQQAETLREESIAARIIAEEKMNQARQILGTGAGQTIFTKGSLYYELELIKRHLMGKYREYPEGMSKHGFDVVIGTAKGVGRPKKNKEA
jgi:hypothetical protein